MCITRFLPILTLALLTAQGIVEYKQFRQSALIDTDVQSFLDRFYMSRIGIRMLIGEQQFF
jgi:hypothetical protein